MYTVSQYWPKLLVLAKRIFLPSVIMAQKENYHPEISQEINFHFYTNLGFQFNLTINICDNNLSVSREVSICKCFNCTSFVIIPLLILIKENKLAVCI